MYRIGKLHGGAPDAYSIMDDVANISGFFTGPPTQYLTSFPTNENPLFEGGLWQLGGNDGLDWNNPKVVGNICFGSTIGAGGAPSGAPFDDNIAHLKASVGISPLNHRVEQRLQLIGSAPSASAEVEILLRFDITNNVARGYEVTFSRSDSFIHLIRWNGALNDFTDLVLDIPFTFADNDLIGAQIVGSTISVDVNGVVQGTKTDTTYPTGQPGLGFWGRTGVTLSDYGVRSFKALSLA